MVGRVKLQPPFSRQRGRYKLTNRNCLKENLKENEKLVAGPRWAPDTKTDWPTGNVTSTSTSKCCISLLSLFCKKKNPYENTLPCV
jgi:hypothetical protein